MSAGTITIEVQSVTRRGDRFIFSYRKQSSGGWKEVTIPAPTRSRALHRLRTINETIWRMPVEVIERNAP